MRRKIFQYPKSGSYLTDFWWNHPMKLSPSGIAIAPWSGHLAISAYEINTADNTGKGHLFIWKKLTDFCNHKRADYHYQLESPLPVAFDDNEMLYVSSPENNAIYFSENIRTAPANKFEVEHVTNPRGLTFGDENEMYLMCGNNQSGRNASILKINNPGDPAIRNMQEMTGSEQSGNGAIAVAAWRNKLYATDFDGLATRTSVNRYIIDENILINKKSMPDTCGYSGSTMDIIIDKEHAYFTNFSEGNAYVTQWDFNSVSPNPTKKFKLGPATVDNHSIYGIAAYEGFIIVADAARNQIKILHESQLEH